MEEKQILKLLNEASEAAQFAYAPYSGFPVGCAILLEDGRIVTGVNIENASFSVTLCAERAAMAQVISQGMEGAIKAIAVVTKCSPPGFPCGICRQFLQEFLRDDTPIIVGNFSKNWLLTNIKELLPNAFNKSSMGNAC